MSDDPPKEWKLSALSRAIEDFNFMLDSESHGHFFRNLESVKGLFDEQKRLTGKIYALYVLTFVGACIVLSGPLPEGAKFALWGVEAPVAIVPQQIIAVATAVAFSTYATQYASLLILSSMIRMTLAKEGAEAWQFFAGRFDASILWSTLIAPRSIGYASPRRHRLGGSAILLLSILTVFAHAMVITTASGFAFWTAWTNGPRYLTIFGAGAVIISLFSLLSLLLLIFYKLPFRLREVAGEKADKTE